MRQGYTDSHHVHAVTYHLYTDETDKQALCGFSMPYLKRIRRELRSLAGEHPTHFPVHLKDWLPCYESSKCLDCKAHPDYPIYILGQL